MRVYFGVFLLTILCQFVSIKSDKQYWWRTIVSFIPLFLFMALRKDYGVDDAAYHWFFDGVQRAKNIFIVNDHMERGFAVLNKIMPSYQSLIVLSSFLTVWAYSYLIYRFVPHKYSWLAVALIFSAPSYTIFFMISGLRNGIAISLFILSCYFIEKRKIIPFTIMTAVAMSIHTSALAIFTISYLLGSNKPLTKSKMLVWIVFMIFLSMASLATIASNALPVIKVFMDQYVGQVGTLSEIADERGIIASLFGIVLAIGIFFYLLFGNKSKDEKIMTELCSIKYKYALLFATSFTIGILSGRMGQYWIYFLIVSVTCMVAYWDKKILKYGFLLIVLFLFRVTYLSWVRDPVFASSYQIYTSILGDL